MTRDDVRALAAAHLGTPRNYAKRVAVSFDNIHNSADFRYCCAKYHPEATVTQSTACGGLRIVNTVSID